MKWFKLKDKAPPNGALIVKRWKNGAVWAGKYIASDKNSSFEEWCLIE